MGDPVKPGHEGLSKQEARKFLGCIPDPDVLEKTRTAQTSFAADKHWPKGWRSNYPSLAAEKAALAACVDRRPKWDNPQMEQDTAADDNFPEGEEEEEEDEPQAITPKSAPVRKYASASGRRSGRRT